MTRPLRVLHAPSSVGGNAALLARAQRDLGVDATSVHYATGAPIAAADEELALDERPPVRRALALGAFAVGALRRFDVFHLYFGHTLLPRIHPDLALLRALGKRVVLHFCGCDLRDRAATLARHPISGCAECIALTCLRARSPRPARAAAVFVATPDLLEFVPRARVMPVPLDLDVWTPREHRKRAAAEPVRIVHAPTDRHIKGTRHLVDAVASLRSAGHRVELRLLEGLPPAEVAPAVRDADLAVDQLMIGAYGAFAAEAMASGLPVVCRVRADLRRHYPADLPLVDADPASIRDVLDALLRDPGAWRGLGERGVEYARREHGMHSVAARALAAYASTNSRNQSSRQTSPQSARP